MESKATISQVFKSGFSFLTVGLTIVLTSMIFFGIAFTIENNFPDLDEELRFAFSGTFGIIGIFILLIGYIGLIRKFMTDGITLGLENGNQLSYSSDISPMNFKETISSGLDLVLVIFVIITVPVIIFASGSIAGSWFAEEVCTEATWYSDYSCEEKPTDLGYAIQIIFQATGVVAFISGILGIMVKIVRDSISQAISKTDY